MAQRLLTTKLSSCETPEMTEEAKNGMQPFETHAILICMVCITSKNITFTNKSTVDKGTIFTNTLFI